MLDVRTFALAGALSFLAACATTTQPQSHAATQDGVDLARSVRVFRGDGVAVSWAELVSSACEADVVFLGENHGHPLGLASAAALFEDVLSREPKTSLSMEFLERDEQLDLDDYLTHVTTLSEFERASGRNPGNFPPGHRAMVEAAASAGRPVHAANAPRRYVSIARKEGFERLRGLKGEQRRLFRIPDALIDGRYREDFDKLMTPADSTPTDESRERLDSVFRSQQMWDWTMGESVARALLSGEHPVFHVVGNFHVNHHGGTVQALERQLPGVRSIVVSYVTQWADELASEHVGRGDFVVYIGPTSEDD